MSHIEMEFAAFVRSLDWFLSGDKHIRHALKATPDWSKRSVAREVEGVQQAVRRLKQAIDLKTHAKQFGRPSTDLELEAEARLNPFKVLKVRLATHLLGTAQFTARPMTLREVQRAIDGR